MSLQAPVSAQIHSVGDFPALISHVGLSMNSTIDFDTDDWFSRLDLDSVPDLDDKVRECEFFFALLSVQTERNQFRWLLSAFLNAAYSFFESTALTAHFRFSDPDGNSIPDHDGLSILRRNVRVVQNSKRPEFVKTAGLTPITKQLYEFRKKNTHYFPLSIMATGPSLPEDFHFGILRGEGAPVLPLCHEAMKLVRSVYAEINP